MRFSVSSPLSLSLVHFCVFLALVATFCQAAPMFKYQSFAAVADKAALDAADYARRVSSIRGPLGVVSPPHEASSSAPRLKLFTETDPETGTYRWRVDPFHVPASNTDESRLYGAMVKKLGLTPGKIKRLPNGIRLTNRGTSARIFRFGEGKRAYYLPGHTTMTVPYGRLTEDQIEWALIHKVPKGTRALTDDVEVAIPDH
ncbi:uncharacterized protein SRS1_16441 [Sporisorium reilianum f. sp. reilianum]|uniref:Uncharacterized protein n=1 Tax=Sporisorium reilianum f. sp. reilianum TaxID=72559 RepID=A0A2N8UM84_9BASI|nr:uncharacterized protein SRS1_16441 [Sporisorium reilianum f. sp. reilianum]